jgi:K+-sensing histidine kinase KdpD
MREEHRDQFEIALQRLREKWIGFDDALTDPDSRFRETILFVRSRPVYLRWITVIVSTLISFVAGLALRDSMSISSQLMLYLPAVLISSLYGGSIAGLASTFLAAACATYVYAEAFRAIGTSQESALSLFLYFIACLIIIWLARAQNSYRERVREGSADLEERVTERTQELRDANKELASFCYSISHDLRAPMRNIVGSSRILLEDHSESLDDEAQLRLRGMADSANRLSSLVDDLLDYARLSGAELNIERIDISDLVEDLCERCKHGSWKFTRLSAKIQPGLVAGGDASLVSQALRSIIENSCKYCKPNTTLSIEFGETRLRGHLWYFIRDNGIGFDMQYARKIFEPFQRLHRDSEVAGTGIGLANVRRIIQRHDGDVFAEASPGNGATFYFRLGSKLPVGPSVTDPISHRVVMADEA